jgi:PAS domain S-box-containing protein
MGLRKRVRAEESAGRDNSWNSDALSVELLVDRLEDKQLILDTISDAIMLLDAHNYKILDVNQAFLDTYKLSYDDFFGRTCFEMTHHLSHPCSQVFRNETCPLETSASTGKMCRVEHAHADHEGNRLHVEITAYPLKSPNGQVQRIIHLARDVTERKLAEEAVERSAEKTKLFAYSMAHDLKGPAIGIHGLAQRLSEHYGENLDDKAKTYCHQILKASEQIAAFVNHINAFINAKETSVKIEPIKLSEILEIVKQEYSAQLNARHIRWSEPGHPIWINADRLSLVRVLGNLLDNALKYGGKELTDIKVGYTETKDFHTLSVADNGIGFKENEAADVFAPFGRMNSARNVEGTGLGLAIVNEIARRHKGRVWYESTIGKGTTFYVEISKDIES